MHTKPALSASDVEFLLAAAKKFATDQGWKVSISVCDDGGHPLGLLRLDGASPFSSHMAGAKARTAALCRKESKHYEEVINLGRPAFLSAPLLEGMIEGGVTIIFDGCAVGAVGVSGVKSPEDAQVARTAIDELLAELDKNP
jgi:glc operon protein GlcG